MRCTYSICFLVTLFELCCVDLSQAAECPARYVANGPYFKTCRGVVDQPHSKGGFTFTTSSIRRNEPTGHVDIYESCIMNQSGRALAAAWQAAHLPDVIVPDGCAFRKRRPSNYLTNNTSLSNFLDTCIRFGNRWEHSDSASYLPTPLERQNGLKDTSCATPVTSEKPNQDSEGLPRVWDFLRQTKEFFWESSTVIDVDKEEQTETLVAPIDLDCAWARSETAQGVLKSLDYSTFYSSFISNRAYKLEGDGA